MLPSEFIFKLDPRKLIIIELGGVHSPQRGSSFIASPHTINSVGDWL